MPEEKPAIAVQNLTKVFRKRHHGYSLKQDLLNGVLRRRAQESVEEFVALNDVSFAVPHGETVAVIGRNGSGKSTLLSILARVYEPTAGSASLYGRNGGKARIAPLLALGAGFHPELDGYENIHFYAAVLGLSPKEIESKRKAIVEFSELEAAMDTGLHTWSDGQKLRLGFSIAVQTDPDILLVDEVLAVGDEAFQNKCFHYIARLQAEGKTILFISHDLVAVEKVANRVIWLNKGVVVMDGNVSEVLSSYREASAVEEAQAAPHKRD